MKYGKWNMENEIMKYNNLMSNTEWNEILGMWNNNYMIFLHKVKSMVTVAKCVYCKLQNLQVEIREWVKWQDVVNVPLF